MARGKRIAQTDPPIVFDDWPKPPVTPTTTAATSTASNRVRKQLEGARKEVRRLQAKTTSDLRRLGKMLSRKIR